MTEYILPFTKSSCRPNVLFLVSTLTVGGSEMKTIRIANSLAKQGWKISIAYLNEPTSLRMKIADLVEVFCLNRLGQYDFSVNDRLVEFMNSRAINVLFCVNLYPLLYGYFSARRCSGVKLLVSINETEFVRFSDKFKMYIYKPLLKRADHLIFGSNYHLNLWTSRYKLPSKLGRYIHNGVDVKYFSRQLNKSAICKLRLKLNILDKAIVIGSIGRFRIEKQYAHLVKACAKLINEHGLTNIHCVLVGGGVERSLLENLSHELGVSVNLHIVDAVDDVRLYLALFDIFVLTSKSETFSNSALEAMAMGIPAVLPRVGGCPEMVDDGVNGHLYAEGDISELTGCLYDLCMHPEERKEMGRNSAKIVQKRFKFEIMLGHYEDELQSFAKDIGVCVE